MSYYTSPDSFWFYFLYCSIVFWRVYFIEMCSWASLSYYSFNEENYRSFIPNSWRARYYFFIFMESCNILPSYEDYIDSAYDFNFWAIISNSFFDSSIIDCFSFSIFSIYYTLLWWISSFFSNSSFSSLTFCNYSTIW